jgi:beta-lactamase superfamily II metal-dependent hydrolase
MVRLPGEFMKTNRSLAVRLLAIGIFILGSIGSANAAAFTPGNIVVYRIGTGAAAITAAAQAVFLDEYTPGGTLVQSIALPTAAALPQRALTTNGTSTAEGLMTRSADGAYLMLPGYDAAPGTTVPVAGVNRVVGRVDSLGNVDTSTTEAGTAGNMRGAASTNGTVIWLTTSAAGIRATTFGSTAAATQLSTTVTNIRAASVFGGQLYISSASGTFQGISTPGNGTPTTSGQTTVGLPGFPTAAGPSPYEFFFADLDATVAGLDTIYLADDRATGSGGGLQKWTFDGTTWTLRGTLTTGLTNGLRGLAGTVSGSNVTLYATDAAASLNKIVTVTDTSGAAAAPTGTFTTVATAGTNKLFRGIGLVPVALTPAPTVSSIVRVNGSPTNAASVDYTVTFSQAVTGVDATDFTFNLSGVSGASVTGVSGSGSTYTVTVNTGSGSGTLRLDVTDNDSIVTGTTPLGGPGAGNGNFTTGEVYTIDKTAPSATSINRASTNPTNAASVNFTVTFSEPVSGVAAGNFTPAMTGVTGATVGTPTGGGTTWTVPVNTGSGSGTLGLDLTSTSGITDAVGNPLSGTRVSDQSYTIDKTPPAVVSIIRVNGSPTAAPNVDYTVTFTEPVFNVDNADFAVTATGVTGAAVTGVTGSGATRTVTVSTGTGPTGTVRLDVVASPTIADGVGNAETTGFTTGEVYNIDRNAPSVSSVVRVSGTPTNAASVSFTVTFSSDVTGVDPTDFQATQGGGVTGATVGTVTPVNASVYTVAVNTGSGDGTIRLDVLNNGSIQSPTAVPLTGGTFTTGEIYTIDKTAPTVSSIVRVEADPTKLAVVHFTATFSESVTGVSASTFALAASGVTGASITGVTGSGTTYTVTANTGSGDGTLGLNAVADAAVLDAAGNAFTAPFTGQLFTVDKTAPTVVSINRANADPTAAASVAYTVTFSEAVTGVDATDFSITAAGPTGTSVGTITGGGTTWTVNVNTGSGDGTLHLDLTDNDSIVDAATNPLGGTGAGNGNATGQTYTIDKNAPSVVSINRVGSASTAAASVSWTVTFSESVTGVDTSDFALVASGVTGTSLTGVTGSGTTWTVSANSGSGSGTLGLNLVDDDTIVETAGFGTALGGPGAGNGNFTGQVFTLDHTAPTVVSIVRASTNPTVAATVQFTVTFSESVTGVGTADFAVAATGVSGASVTNVTGSGTTYTVTANTGTGSGTVGLNLVDDDSIIDGVSNPLGGAGAGNGNFTGEIYTVNRAPANHVVISQVYGGGGNGGATYRNDFIELFNPTGGTVSLTGWSVQYASATGSSWQVTNLTGSIAPGHYYLVQESSNAAVGAVLPTPDVSAGILMAAGAGKVALVNQTSALSGSCPLGITVIDFVGYGTTANCSEGAPTGTPSATISESRIDNGCTDTDHNNTDFTSGAVNPRNTASPSWSCGGLVGNGTATPSTVSATGTTLLRVTVTPGQSPASTGITAVADLTPIGGSATQTLYDDGTNGDVTIGDNIFSFNATVGAATTSGSKILNVSLADAQTRTGAATITLNVLGATNPTGSGNASPASVAPTQSSLLTVVVTPGQNPTSSGITASVNLTSIGGSSSQTLFDNGTNGDVTPGDGTFSYNATVANGTTLGAKSLPVTILDAQSRIGSASISLTVQSATAPPAPLNLVATPGNAQVSLTWGTAAGATGYNVYRSTTSGFYTTALVSNVAATNYTDNAVSNGTTYYYIVKATNGTEESGPSNEASALPAAPQPAAGAKIYFIDIGQGASTLIVSPTGKTLLVDGGPTGQGNAKIVPLLATLGINTIDYTILTHYHIDHDDGLLEVINAGKVAGTAYDNGDTAPLIPPNFSTSPSSTYGTYARYLSAISSHPSVTRVRPEDVGGSLAGTVIDLGGGMKATILEQGGKLLSGGAVPIDNSDLNTESISTLIEYNNFDFLVSGDMTGGGSTSTAKTPDVETFVAQLAGDIDIVEYDHHGSTTANNPRFLKLLKAEAAVAEIGFTNTFGHPNRETVNKYLNKPVTSGATYGGTALPNPGGGPVSYQTDPSPASDDRVSRQGYSGAAPANAGNGTILLKTDGTTSFTMESFEDGGVRLSPAQHAFSLDATGAGITTNFPPTVIPTISPVVPLSTDTVTVQAMVNDKEDPISSVSLTYALNGTAQGPVTMTLNAGFYEATISAQPNGTRVDYTVTATAGGKSTAYSSGYFAGITPISSLRVLDSLGEPLYLDYAARIQGTATSDTNVFSVGTNDDYIQDATGGINIWRTLQPTVPAIQTIASGSTYTIAGRIGELAGRFHLETTPPFASNTTPYTITQTGSATVTPAVMTIAQINANPEGIEAQLVQINNCTVTSGTISGSSAADSFLTISDGTGSFQIKIDKDTNIPGMATPTGAFSVIGIIQQDDFLRPFDSGYNIAPRSRADLGGSNPSGPGLISIAAARIDVDAGGNTPGDYVPDLLNSTVHVQGVVTSINFRASSGTGIEYYIQDSTAGVDVFSTAQTRSLNIGDNVDVIATVKQFNGLTEIDPGATTTNLSLLAPGTLPAVTPQLTTASQLADSGIGEPLEGLLVRLNNITLTAPPATWVASTNYAFTDASGSCGTCTIRISPSSNLVGQAAPAGPFSIIGVLGQFDSAAPFDSGYQIFPRSTSDILSAVPATGSISSTAGTPQSATVGTPFAQQLQATVRDAGNAPISGAGVTFTAPGSGASGTFSNGTTTASVITDASGVATSPVFTANATAGSYSVGAANGSFTTTFSLTNLAQSATHFSVTAPANVTSGVAFNVTVTALNASNAVVTSYAGTVHFSSGSNGSLPADYTFIAGDNGTHTFSATLTTPGAQQIDVGDGSISGSANVTVAPPPATHFSVTAPANVTSGVAFNVTVTALDASNATVPSYTGTVHFTSSSAGTLPADYTFVGGDNGAHTFSVTLSSTGSQSVTATDTVTASITGSANTTVAPPPATHFSVTAPANVTSGASFNVTVTALDASNATVPSYTGIVHFTSSSAGSLPADYTFVAGDNGAHTFSVTLTSTGSQSVTATDTVTASITGSANTTVAPPPATHFSVTAPANVTSGAAFNVTVTALDASNATVPGYTGTIHFTSSSAGTLPADYTFVAGDNGAHTFSVTLTSTGSQSITATDTVTASITGTTNTTVAPPPATHFSVTAPANVTSGAAFNVTVTALDASNATVPSYTGTVHFTSSSAGTLPADYTFVGGDNGAHTFSVTLTSTGSQSVTATDTVTASITGSANTTVAPPPATHFSVTAPANVTSGASFNVTVTALDASNATVTGYTGTIHFTSSSAGTLPADYTFVGGDNGAHTFSVTLTSAGSQSVTATDTVTASITGSANTTVAPPPATHFSLTAPASVTTGTPFNVTVTALAASNATATGYTGTVHFTSSSAGTLPADYTFVAGDNGSHTFSVTLTSTGSQTITATDTVTASITGTTATTVLLICPPGPAPTANASNGGPACAGTTVNLFATGNGSIFSWTGPGGFTSSLQNPTGITVAGTYTVTVSSPGPCGGSAQASTTVVINPLPSATITTPATVCATSAGNIASVPNAGAGATYAWSITNGSITSGSGTASITYTAGSSGGVHLTVTVTTAAGCSAAGSADAAVATRPTITLPATINAACGASSVNIPFTLTGVGPWNVLWSDGISQNGITSPSSSRNVTVSGSMVLTAIVSDGSCSNGSAPVSINVSNAPVITTQPVGQIVQPAHNATFTVVASGANLHYQWFVKHANGATLAVGTDSPSYTTNPEGNAMWFVRVTNTCGSVDSERVTALVVTPRHHASH